MTTTSDPCPHPADIEACRRLLVKAKQDETIDRHCILNGLRAGGEQCRRVLLEGLAKQESQDMAGGVSPQELRRACEEVILCGYPLGIKAIPDLFIEAYHRLICYTIQRFGYRNDGIPAADDVFQEVCYSLHQYFRAKRRTTDSLAAYVVRVTFNICWVLKKKYMQNQLKDGKRTIRHQNPSMDLVPPDVIDTWEDQDCRLTHTKQGDLINRIIVAHICVEGWSASKPPSAKDLRASWSLLEQMPQKDIASLIEKSIKEARRLRLEGVVRKTAHCLNSGLARNYQIAVVFAAAIGQSPNQINKLIKELTNLSDNAIFTRISRIYRALWESRE
jgi:hypothetical protein